MTLEQDLLPHRRKNPLTDEWVLCSPHRAKRPWQGAVERPAPPNRPEYDPKCYLCPGNTRANGEKNPAYTSTHVFENDFRALLDQEGAVPASSEDGLLQAQAVQGTCRVICFSPRHDLTLAQMDLPAIEGVIRTWGEQTRELGERYAWVQVFENKGSAMGCSNPHPHGQIWALDQLPTIPAKEDACQRRWHQEKGSRLLLDYVALEIERGERVVDANDDWAAVVPFWATWPFELLLLPRFPVSRLCDLDEPRQASLAAILKRVLVRYDNLFETEFPYSMGWHGAPFVEGDLAHWQLHAHFYPPLLRSATVRKFMVGYEMMAEAQRDITPEAAAARLRELSTERFA
ncbi:MAG: UDP-glucose--hexose-1-phosphate uridylyltransferase [Verrucomicrobia bacterium]|nr:MAG: UDP-glucose--hexose-1-phosphate uridylyltransferase [Verrucomicrobiota bacterium]